MTRKLINLKLSEVSLVDKPSNPGAQILLSKRDNSQGGLSVCERIQKGAIVDRDTALLEFLKGIDLACPNCGAQLPTTYQDGDMEMPNYCPECGAKLGITATGGDQNVMMRALEKTEKGKEFYALYRRLPPAQPQAVAKVEVASTRPKSDEFCRQANALVEKRQVKDFAEGACQLAKQNPALYSAYCREVLAG